MANENGDALSPQQVSREYPGLNERYLQHLRSTGKGPAYSKLSRSKVLYTRAAIAEWLAASERRSTSGSR